MQFSLDMGDGSTNYIRAYDTGKVTINKTEYQHSLIVSPTTIIENWPPKKITDLTNNDLRQLIDLKPEVSLLGTGETLVFPAPELLQRFTELGIGVEVMTTGAACRTYNVLMAEGRNIVAGLIIEAVK